MSDLQQRENPYNVTQASRIYFLPNLMTAGNLFCGFAAVIKCIQARLITDGGEYAVLHPNFSSVALYTQAVWLILAAVIFDSLDGRLARMGGRTSLFGAEFDSLADVVSFGMTPALMVFFLILAPREDYQWFRELGWIVAFVVANAYGARLAVLLPETVPGQTVRLMHFLECYDPLYYACDETLHARPDRKAPEDEAVLLVEAINSAANTMERAMKALDHIKARGGIRAVA